MIITVAGLPGSGKSTVCAEIKSNFPKSVIIDLDDVNTELLKKQQVKDFAFALFDDIVFQNGHLNKNRISELIYNDKMLYHNWCQFMKENCQQHVEKTIAKAPTKLYVIEHVLINELDVFNKSTLNILVQLEDKERLERVAKRDNITRFEAEKREQFLKEYNAYDFHMVCSPKKHSAVIQKIHEVTH